MKEQKVGLTATNWILSILGILILSLLIILPPVFRVVFKEEEVILPQPEPVLPVTTTTCTIENRIGENYTERETISLEHRGTELENYTKDIQRTYTDPSVYETDKQNHGRLVTAYSILSGFTYSITPNDETFVLSIHENYDLNTFQESTLVIPGDTEPTTVNSEYQLKDSVTIITQDLTTNGYLCTSDSTE